jgi:phosphoenolpyruvate carboxykinase (ATP)
VGKRISIAYTRGLLKAVLNGKLLGVEYVTDPVFGFQVPRSCEGVPSSVLNPAASWPNKEQYLQRYRQLAFRFVDNFKKFEAECRPEVVQAGPVSIGISQARLVSLQVEPSASEDEREAVTAD